MSLTFRLANRVMAAGYVLSVLVQYNDPDPIRWMLIYGLAAVACGLAFRWRCAWLLSAGVALVASIWAFLLTPNVVGKVSFAELFVSVGMKSREIEYGREFGGLLFVAVWMLVLSFVSFRHSFRRERASVGGEN